MNINLESKQKSIIFGSSIFAVLLVAGIFPTINFAETEVQTAGFPNDTTLKGTFFFTLTNSDNEIIREWQHDNLVNNEGMECVADAVFGTTDCTAESLFQHISLGTDGTAEADGDTDLIAESGTCARVQDATPALDTGTTGEREVTVSSTFSGGTCEGIAFAETGLHDDGSAGNMYARTTISPTVTLGSGDSLQVDYVVNINNT